MRFLKAIFVLAVATVMAGCGEDVPQGVVAPGIVKAEAFVIEDEGDADGATALVRCITSSTAGVKDCGVETAWGNVKGHIVDSKVFETRLENLARGRTYTFKAYADNGFSRVFSEDIYLFIPEAVELESTDPAESEDPEESIDPTDSQDPDISADPDVSQEPEVIPEEMRQPIVFADENLGKVLRDAFDTDGDGELSLWEASKVKSFDGVLHSDEPYLSFDEFQYFTSITAIGCELDNFSGQYVIPVAGFGAWKLLTSIVLPPSLTTIGDYAFGNCISLSSIVVPESVESIGEFAFGECISLKEIEIPSSVTSIGKGAFSSCESLQEIVIPEGLSTLSERVFERCSALKKAVLPESLREIGQSAFDHCSNLTQADIPSGVRIIGGIAFSFTSIVSAVIPEGITTLYGHMFSYDESLEHVTLPSTLIQLGGNVFTGCKSLKHITLPDNLVFIDWAAFGDSGLEEIVIPARVRKIEDQTFWGCKSLQYAKFLGLDPPLIYSTTFDTFFKGPIYVPAEAVDAYKTAPYFENKKSRIYPITDETP